MTPLVTPPVTMLVDNLTFTEGPRWHNNRLYFSDFFTHRVMSVDYGGNLKTIVELDDQPSGLGWAPNGDLLIVAMTQRKLLGFNGKTTYQVSDLSPYATWHCNDMLVTDNGIAYIGNFGCDFENEDLVPANLIKVDLNINQSPTSVAAEQLCFPNGTVITADAKTLIVAESFAFQLTAFDIDDNGDLSNRRVWAALDGYAPDGICMDEASGIWVAAPGTHSVIRVIEGGEITHKFDLERESIACALGSKPGSKTLDQLFLCVSQYVGSEDCKANTGAGIAVIDLSCL